MGARFRARGAPTGDDGAPIGLPEAVGVCALGVVLGVVAHGVKVARVVGDGAAVGVRHDVVLVWLIMAQGCTDHGEGVAVGVACLLVS